MIDNLSVLARTTNRFNCTDEQNDPIDADNTLWWASDYLELLGYPGTVAYNNPVKRAMQACRSEGVAPDNHFIKATRYLNGHSVVDIKLTRYACQLVAMSSEE